GERGHHLPLRLLALGGARRGGGTDRARVCLSLRPRRAARARVREVADAGKGVPPGAPLVRRMGTPHFARSRVGPRAYPLSSDVVPRRVMTVSPSAVGHRRLPSSPASAY